MVLAFSFDISLNVMYDKNLCSEHLMQKSGKKRKLKTDNLRAFWKVLDLVLW